MVRGRLGKIKLDRSREGIAGEKASDKTAIPVGSGWLSGSLFADVELQFEWTQITIHRVS